MTRLLRRARGGDPGPEAAGDDRPETGEPAATAETGAPEAAETEASVSTAPGAVETAEPGAAGATEADAAETVEPGAGEGETPDAEAQSTPDQGAPSTDKATTRRSRVAWRKIALAAALTCLLLGGSGFFYAAHQLRSAPSARNHALTDTAATDRVSGEVAEGLARVFSYTPADTDTAERSSRTVLAGRAARQYGDLLAQVRTKLVGQRITLSTQAVRTGVIELDGDTARLLVFLDQTSRRDEAAATTAAAQLTVTAKYRGDRWLIVDIKAR
ncbi:hypothetical protein [Streptomyces litmocidini]|uniref:Mce-associated membrane protein n=1 Tax=Streptomyces litmocidini TaxID=67318 RepID=A0ABW7UBG8_9ACTN